ncbi:DUF6058 family natural product biosynthesis protein [Solimicrobium silvestre]|uniref:Orphan protein n=1 Tax=Solimicrobium silvestre TaxID=2099400 RepID=A0A2S9H3I3_9BURK|nr:DUF6058 family natural product biosynthesis protein [Solimicrobium silvestre]PRC94542.1 hypothetical protein S2091_0545 [Solimicrobium silvestre]
MELIHYLNNEFFTQQQLLVASEIDLSELETLQLKGLMPRPSYSLKLDLSCNSFFGLHQEQANLDYYAKSYAGWIAEIRPLTSSADAFRLFSDRYKARLRQLYAALDLRTHNEKLNAGLDAHITSEWTHFLAGIYGLCTKSGLPEDIAAKELAIMIINQITELRANPILSQTERARLTVAVNLLDEASSSFAPHEVLRSSRHRLIDQMRINYSL